jgi:hypothetical protein
MLVTLHTGFGGIDGVATRAFIIVIYSGKLCGNNCACVAIITTPRFWSFSDPSFPTLSLDDGLA